MNESCNIRPLPRTAAEWFAARHGPREADLEPRFADWLREDPKNADEYALCELTWALAGDAASSLIVDAPVTYGVSGGGVYDARTGGLLGLVEGFTTARLTAQGSSAGWYVDVPVPGQTLVTPLSEVRQFLADIERADLLPR